VGGANIFFKEIAAGIHGVDALGAVLDAPSLDWQDLDPYLWPALHDVDSRKALLTGCWVRPEVKEFFKKLFEERYGNLVVCVAVAADKPDFNPISHAIWPHLNKKGKLNLLNAKYAGNFCPKSLGMTTRNSTLNKNIIKTIKHSALLDAVTLPEFSEFCEAVWPKMSMMEDRRQVLTAQYPGSFYRDLCEKKFGETPLQKALSSHDLLLNDNWMANVWPELSPYARKVYLAKATFDWRKAFFFEGLSGNTIGALAHIPYNLLSTESESKLIRILWPLLSDSQRSWWTENGYPHDEED